MRIIIDGFESFWSVVSELSMKSHSVSDAQLTYHCFGFLAVVLSVFCCEF